MDSKNIKECIEILYPTKEERQRQVKDIIDTFKD